MIVENKSTLYLSEDQMRIIEVLSERIEKLTRELAKLNFRGIANK